jgi:hypothetical protein
MPAHLVGDNIPLGARVLRAASEYERLRSGSIETRRFSHDDACAWLRNGSGTRFDPKVAETFLAVLKEAGSPAAARSLAVSALKPGMVLASDLVAGIGVLLLSKDHLLDDTTIRRLDAFQRRVGKSFDVLVYRNTAP